MKVTPVIVNTLNGTGFDYQQSVPGNMLNDILVMDDIFIFSIHNLTSIDIKKLKSVLNSKRKTTCVIVAYDQTNQLEQLSELTPLQSDSFFIINTMNNDEFFIEAIKKSINKFTLSNIIENYSKKADIDYTEVEPGQISLPINYIPFSLVEPFKAELPDIEMKLIEEEKVPDNFEQAPIEEDSLSQVEREKRSVDERISSILQAPATQDEALDLIKQSVVEYNVDSLKTHIQLDEIVRGLQRDSAEYHSLKTAVEIIDNSINSILIDPNIGRGERLDKIIELIRTKQDKRTSIENIETKRFLEILKNISNASTEKIDEIVTLIENKYSSTEIMELYKENERQVNELVQEAAREQISINNIILSMNKTVSVLDASAVEILTKFSKDGLTASEVVNMQLKPSIGSGLSLNIEECVNKILEAITQTESDLTLNINRLQQLIKSIYNLNNLTKKIANKTDYLNKYLVANRFENTVAITNPFKLGTRLFVGAENSGKTVTAHIAAKLKSRQVNSCVVDLSTRSKLYKYTEVSKLSDIKNMQSILKKDYLAIYNDDPNMSLGDIQKTIDRLLEHYKYVTIIVSNQDKEYYDFLVDKVLSVNFVIDDTEASVSALSPYLKGIALNNTAVNLVEMYTDLTPIDICELYDVDVTRVKVISIPKMKEIRKATNSKSDPTQEEAVKLTYQNLFE